MAGEFEERGLIFDLDGWASKDEGGVVASWDRTSQCKRWYQALWQGTGWEIRWDFETEEISDRDPE